MANPAQRVVAPPDWLIQKICNWIANPTNNAHVREAMLSRGGWEVWLQLELLFAFRPLVIALNQHNTVDRERNQIWVNSPNDRVDFWFTWNGQDPNAGQYLHWGVELKCRTNAESHSVFNGRVLGDFDKCNQQPNVAAFGRTAMYAVAISSDVNDINDFNPFNYDSTFYTTVPHAALPPIYVIWRTVHH